MSEEGDRFLLYLSWLDACVAAVGVLVATRSHPCC
jgi:hypothetical protein